MTQTTKVKDLPEKERGLLEEMVHVSTMLLAQQSHLRPFAIIMTEKEQTYMSIPDGVDWDGSTTEVRESKAEFVNLARFGSVKYNATGVAYAAEAWVLSLGSPEAIEKFKKWKSENPTASYENYEGRIECVIVHVETDRGRVLTHFPMHRAAGTREPWLDELTEEHEVSFQAFPSKEWLQTTMNGDMSMLFVPSSLRDDVIRKAADDYFEAQGAMRIKLENVPSQLPPRSGSN